MVGAVRAACWLAVSLAGLVVVASAAAGGPRFEQHGIALGYPDGWQLSPEPMSNLVNPAFRFTVATFAPVRVRADRGPCLAGLARERGARGAYAYLLEDLDAGKYLRRFPTRPPRFRLPVAGEQAGCDGRWSRWIPFRQAGRGFYLGLSIGARASAHTRAQLRRILSSLMINRPGRTDGDARTADVTPPAAPFQPQEQWDLLRRPLRLPRLAEGEPCPRTPGRRAAPNVAITLGSGPAYPVLGFSDPPTATRGAISLRDDIRRNGRYQHKTLWAISSSYHGPVLVRGRRLDGRGALHFQGPTRRELRLPRGAGKPENSGKGWRYAPTSTLIAQPGCYGFQIDGNGFSRTVVFAATP